MIQDALYYPYIHFRDENWLKKTLLVFPRVHRMVPRFFFPNDTATVAHFEHIGLLNKAQLETPGTGEALDALLSKIKADIEKDETFRQRFGRHATEALKVNNEPGYQIHCRKAGELMDSLRHLGLAWEPARSDGHEYLELHPQIGDAVMSTLATACALDAGLSIVTDDGKLHQALIRKAESDIYDTIVRQRETGRLRRAKASDLIDLVIFQRCNVEKLTPENLAKLRQERAPLDSFRFELKRIADSIPKMRDERAFEKRLRAEVADILKRWQQDKANLSKYARGMLGGSGKPAADFLKKIAEHAAGDATKGAMVGGLTTGSLLGAAAGMGIALVVTVTTSVIDVRKKALESPFRFLSLLEEGGAAFTVGVK